MIAQLSEPVLPLHAYAEVVRVPRSAPVPLPVCVRGSVHACGQACLTSIVKGDALYRLCFSFDSMIKENLLRKSDCRETYTTKCERTWQ